VVLLRCVPEDRQKFVYKRGDFMFGIAFLRSEIGKYCLGGEQWQDANFHCL